jgi:16S rRNA G966 N2-methylase RsmD
MLRYSRRNLSFLGKKKRLKVVFFDPPFTVGIYPASTASEKGRLHPALPVEGAT